MTKTTKPATPAKTKGRSPKAARPAKSAAPEAAPSLLPPPSESSEAPSGLTLAQAEASTVDITFADLGLSAEMRTLYPLFERNVAEGAS